MNNLTYLVDICDFQGGTQPPKKQWSKFLKDGYIRMLQIRDFTQFEKVEPEYVKYSTKLKTCKSDDILIARYGASLGKILTGLSGAYNVAIMKTIPNENKITKKYLYYYFLSDSFQNTIKNFGSRAAQAGFNKEDLSLIKLKCPSIEKQEEQCLVLNYIYNLIDKRRRQILLLDKLVKSRFIEMFGDPLKNTLKWKIKKLKLIAPANEFTGDIESNNEKYWLLQLDMIESNTGKILSKYFVSLDKIGVSTIKFSRDNVLYSKLRPYLNKVVLPDEAGFATSEMIPLFPTEELNKIFLAFVLRDDGIVRFLNAHVSGSKMPRVQADVFWNLGIILPPSTLQNQFADFVEQTDKSKFVNYKCLQTAANIYRQEWMRCQTSNF
jgi:type I restriction enzyme S subunit